MSSELPYVETMLYAMFEPGAAPPEGAPLDFDQLGAILPPPEKFAPTRIHDARTLQARSTLEPHAFFEEHGFVLLPHVSAVTEWDAEGPDSEPERIYSREAEALSRTLLPGRKLEIYQGPPIRRGPGTANPDYANGVHQDAGLSLDDYQANLEAFTSPLIANWWRERVDRDDVEGFLMIDFWRPVKLDGPLRHMPLALCEPRSVHPEDYVPIRLLGLTPTGLPTNQLSMRYRADHRWYYYPDMTKDEVLAFKNYEFSKEAPPGRTEACFHSAFDDPTTPADAPERQSSEHRVSVFLLRD